MSSLRQQPHLTITTLSSQKNRLAPKTDDFEAKANWSLHWLTSAAIIYLNIRSYRFEHSAWGVSPSADCVATKLGSFLPSKNTAAMEMTKIVNIATSWCKYEVRALCVVNARVVRELDKLYRFILSATFYLKKAPYLYGLMFSVEKRGGSYMFLLSIGIAIIFLRKGNAAWKEFI